MSPLVVDSDTAGAKTPDRDGHEANASMHRSRAAEALVAIRRQLSAVADLVGPGVALPIERRLEDLTEHESEAHWYDRLRREELRDALIQETNTRDAIAGEFILLLAELDKYVRRSRTEPSDRIAHWRSIGQSEAKRMSEPF